MMDEASVKKGGTNNNVDGNGGCVMKLQLGPGKVIQAKSSPQDQEIEIHRVSNSKKNEITDDDCAFLKELGDASDADDALETHSVDTSPSQASRFSKIFVDWPSPHDVDCELGA